MLEGCIAVMAALAGHIAGDCKLRDAWSPIAPGSDRCSRSQSVKKYEVAVLQRYSPPVVLAPEDSLAHRLRDRYHWPSACAVHSADILQNIRLQGFLRFRPGNEHSGWCTVLDCGTPCWQSCSPWAHAFLIP